jgi:SAM-dependent methyltransferase
VDAAPRLYGELATWFHLLTAPEDYAEEAEIFRRIIADNCDGPALTVLELGSGGGNNASHLKAHFALTLVDRSLEMLGVSRELNPECEHVEGDMRTVRLGRQFDAVFVHDAVSYLTSEDDIGAAMETAFAHCRPGGVALFVPDCVRETFKPETRHGGHDSPDGQGLRYVEWTWDPDPADTSYLMELGMLLREPDGAVAVEHDRHELGLFSRATWLRLLAEVGFDARSLPLAHSKLEPGSWEVFVGKRR